MEMKWTIRRE